MSEEKDVKKAEKIEEKKVEEKNKTEVKNDEAKEQTVKKEPTKKEVKKEEKPKKEEKKTEKKAEETKGKKSKNGIIALVVVIVALLVVALLCNILTMNTPEKTVEKLFNALKTGNYEQANELINYNELVKSDFLENEELGEEAQKLLFLQLEWKIKDTKKENDTATIEVEVTNKDFKTIIGNYVQKAIKAAFSGQEISDEQMTNYLIEELNNTEIQNVTNTQTIILKKQDGNWKISEEDNNLANILLPGFEEAINSFQ